MRGYRSVVPESPSEPDIERGPEDRPDEPGAEGGASSPAADKLPGAPEPEDETPAGDTDQHSNN